ncbi:vWA domain-containing protein [Flexithrix dorotheae]|uniref:vWA domain-containing protein n=1 Tax=Flexithrix dorotheae TaxID=70993 RepID=UPI00037F5992|nr:VWA domain-containing protein [Flexithrix dorotheae]
MKPNFKVFFIFLSVAFLSYSCGNDDPDPVDVNQCTTPITTEDNGLILVHRTTTSAAPANVSVLFNAHQRTGNDTLPVKDLVVDNISVFENGQPISPFESEFGILPKPNVFVSHTLLVLDLSGSVLQTSLTELKAATTSFIEEIVPVAESDEYGELEMQIMWFDGGANLNTLVPFTKDRSTLISGVENITEDLSNDNSTNLNGAVIESVDIMESIIGQSGSIVRIGSIALFTDGTDQAGRRTKADALKEVANAQNKGITMNTIGLGGSIDESTLMAFGPDGFFFAQNVNELGPKFKEAARIIRDEVNSTYLFQYCSPKRAGSHELKIVVNYAGGKEGSITSCFSATGFTGGCVVEE